MIFNINSVARIPNIRERFLSKASYSGACLLWNSTINVDGYGILEINRKHVRAHRIAVVLSGREIGKGLQVDHICRVRQCVNAEHLEIVDCKTNVLRGIAASAINARKSRCVNGHRFTPENTYVRCDRKGGGRGCRACRNEASRKNRRRTK